MLRRRENVCCKSKQPLPEIPFDLVIEILRRLPGKSLMRFKSVSKLWSSLICSKYFTDRFLNVSSSMRVYMTISMTVPRGSIESPLKDLVLLSSSCPDSDITTTMSSFVLDQDLTIPSDIEDYSISHIFGGLMCLSDGLRALIYNTTTRQLFVLPRMEEECRIKAQDHKITYRIGHDPVHHRYKVFCMVTSRDGHGEFMPEHWVLLLGGDVTSEWRKIVHIASQPHYLLHNEVTIINGCMRYLASVPLSYDLLLVSLDMISEEISMLQLPEYWSHTYNNLIEYGGGVALFDDTDFEDQGVLKLKFLEDVEKNTWLKKTLTVHPCQMHMLTSHCWTTHCSKNGELISVLMILTRNCEARKIEFNPQATNIFHALVYNLQKNHLRKVEIKEPSSRYLNRFWVLQGFDDVENLIHL